LNPPLNPPLSAASHFSLDVEDQQRSATFYSAALALEPRLHVPGMTEYVLPGGGILGLMPESGVRSLLGAGIPDPAAARGTPRAELYLVVSNPGDYHARALSAGGRELSPMLPRDWGHVAAYSQDPDGHVLAFASIRDRPGHPTAASSATTSSGGWDG
jgi:predicted enzyme related to lactoylglutathione lyase